MLYNQPPICKPCCGLDELGIQPIACGDAVFGGSARDSPRLHVAPRETLQRNLQRRIQVPAFIEALADRFPTIGAVEQIKPFDDNNPRSGRHRERAFNRIAHCMFKAGPRNIAATS